MSRTYGLAHPMYRMHHIDTCRGLVVEAHRQDNTKLRLVWPSDCKRLHSAWTARPRPHTWKGMGVTGTSTSLLAMTSGCEEGSFFSTAIEGSPSGGV